MWRLSLSLNDFIQNHSFITDTSMLNVGLFKSNWKLKYNVHPIGQKQCTESFKKNIRQLYLTDENLDFYHAKFCKKRSTYIKILWYCVFSIKCCILIKSKENCRCQYFIIYSRGNNYITISSVNQEMFGLGFLLILSHIILKSELHVNNFIRFNVFVMNIISLHDPTPAVKKQITFVYLKLILLQ